MKRLTTFFASLLTLSVLAAAAHAFEPGACRPDIEKYCKNAKLEGGQLKACLKEHIHELSDPCKANLVDLWLEKKQSEGKK